MEEEEKKELFAIGKDMNERHNEEIELRKQIEAVRVETYNRIKDNPEVKEFLAPYNSHFHDFFLQNYATSKGMWVSSKDTYKNRLDESAVALQNIAQNAFACVLKKKMIDIRREWGAGSFELPGMNTPFDFMEKTGKVFELDWIPPIDEQDMECLVAYVEQHTGFDLEFLFRYDSENFVIPFKMEENNVHESEGSFFAFHSEYTGSGHLKVLPDKRGEKYMAYIKAVNKKLQEEKEAKIASGELPPEKEFDMRPFPPTDKPSFIEAFIKKFDDRETLQNYRNYREYHGDDEDEDGEETPASKVTTILAHLDHLKVVLPVKANEDWRLALIESWEEYRRKSIIEAIKDTYGDYLFHVETGIAYTGTELKPETIKSIADLKEKLLNGRELMGEPQNFDL